jgi:hypothetical protein
MGFLITLTSDDVYHVAGLQRWMDTVELVAFGNLDGEGRWYIHIFKFEENPYSNACCRFCTPTQAVLPASLTDYQ